MIGRLIGEVGHPPGVWPGPGPPPSMGTHWTKEDLVRSRSVEEDNHVNIMQQRIEEDREALLTAPCAKIRRERMSMSGAQAGSWEGEGRDLRHLTGCNVFYPHVPGACRLLSLRGRSGSSGTAVDLKRGTSASKTPTSSTTWRASERSGSTRRVRAAACFMSLPGLRGVLAQGRRPRCPEWVKVAASRHMFTRKSGHRRSSRHPPARRTPPPVTIDRLVA